MYIAKVTNDFDNITSSNYTDYDNVTSSNDNMTLSICTFNENDIDILIPSILFTIPCVLSFLCLMSLMVYTFLKPLINNRWKKFYNLNIQLGVS